MAQKIEISANPKFSYNTQDLSGLFGGVQLPSSTGKEIIQLDIVSLAPYANQPFKPYRPDKMELLVEDVRANGVLSPIIVRAKGTGYEILAGHNRTAAAKKAGLSQVPAIIVDADDDTAALIMVNTNLNQREELLPSEKAFAYKIQLEAMKRKAGRPSQDNCGQLGHNSDGKKSRDILSEQMGESARSIQRLIRLTRLIPELLEQVDNGELKLVPAVALSHLEPEEQLLVLEVSADCQRKISVFQSNQLKAAAGKLDAPTVRSILLPQKEWNPRQQFSSRSSTLIPGTATPEDVDAVLALIESYFKERRGMA